MRRLKPLPFVFIGILVFAIFVWFLGRRDFDVAPPSQPLVLSNVKKIERWLLITTELKRWDRQSLQTNSFAPSARDFEADQLTLVLLKKGPNLTPAVVEVLRTCTNRYYLTNLVLLLSQASSISLRFERDKTFPAARDVMDQIETRRNNFIKAWDNGTIQNPPKETLIATFARVRITNRIHSEDFSDISNYGVFALPITIEYIAATNSVPAMAFFISKASLVKDYGYWFSPSNMFVLHEEKLAKIKQWWADSQTQYYELRPLYERIDTAIKAFPTETREVSSE